jgi:DNA-binding SARP family transcriptional activator/predicted ATPase
MTIEAGTLRLLTSPRWLPADGAGHDLPDSLPGYLLAYLAYRGDWVAREALAAEFWPTRGEQEALGNLRANLHRVRELLATWGQPQALRAEPRRVRMDLRTDVGALRAALSRADWAAAGEFEGDRLLQSMSFRGFARIEEWAVQERRALAVVWRDAALRAARLQAQAAQPQRAAALLLQLLREDIANEAALRELLRLAKAADRRGEALAAYERYRQWLKAELELAPATETAELADVLERSDEPSGRGGETSTRLMADEPALLLFGAPALRAAPALSITSERRFQLLVMLALRDGEWIAREQLAALLWPDQPTADARRNLRHTLFKAREFPGTDGLEANDHALRWNVATDVQAFRRALHEKRPGDALRLYRGALAAGVDDPGNPAFSDWIAAERARLQGQWRQAVLDHLQGLQAPAERIELARALLLADPLDEAAFAVLLAAELALGHATQAQRLYRDYAARLADELGIEPPQHLRDLLAGASAAHPTSSFDDGGAFVGRRTELAELSLLLQQPDCRLITILGPGGAGKSSLARRLLAREAPRFPDGAVWVELQDLESVPPVLARLAEKLDLTLNDAPDPLRQIARQLQSRRTLIVFDNAEHLVELGALVQRLIDEADGVKVLLTSRIRTHSRDERLLPLDGLPVPDEESRDLQVAANFDAVRLFDLRARAVQRGFDLARHLPAVIRIVEAVGGLPLAIELAAAWTRLLPAEEIARDLDTSIEVLERDPAASGAPARPEHASLRHVLDRSWQLLSPSERDAMAALSVFQGGFTHAAARAVASVPLPLLSSLVDKSFLTNDRTGRFGAHPLVTALAAERLTADPRRAEELRRRHGEYYSQRVAELDANRDSDPRPMIAAIESDWANCVAAWHWALSRRRMDLIGATVAVWGTYFNLRERRAEGLQQLRPVLELPITDASSVGAQIRLRSTFASLCIRGGFGPTMALSALRPTFALALRSGNTGDLAGYLSWVAASYREMGQRARARRHQLRALRIARRAGDRSEEAAALNNLCAVDKLDGRYDDAERSGREALALETELGHRLSAARVMINLAGVYMERAEWAEARKLLEGALKLASEFRIDSLQSRAEFTLGAVEIDLGALEAAERHLRSVAERFRRLGDLRRLTRVEYNLARIAAKRGGLGDAVRLLAPAARRAAEGGWQYEMLHVVLFFGECLRDTGDRIDAARAWQAVIDHPLFDAGVRDSALRWTGELALTPAEQREAASDPATVDGVIERILLIAEATEAANAGQTLST